MEILSLSDDNYIHPVKGDSLTTDYADAADENHGLSFGFRHLTSDAWGAHASRVLVSVSRRNGLWISV